MRIPLPRARVLIAGAGGLGCPAALSLAQAGVGHLTVVDPDVVELSNLHRQPLYAECDLGQPKARVAATRLRAHFPEITVQGVVQALSADNAQELLAEHHVVVDATDRLETKLWLNDVCVRLGVPLVHAGALGWQGQLCTILPGRSACLRCLIREPEADPVRSSCHEAGIVGPVVGFLGARQATEVLLYLDGQQEALLVDRMLFFDGQRASLRIVRFRRDPACPACAPAGSKRLPRS